MDIYVLSGSIYTFYAPLILLGFYVVARAAEDKIQKHVDKQSFIPYHVCVVDATKQTQLKRENAPAARMVKVQIISIYIEQYSR